MNALGNAILRLLRLPPQEEGQGAYSVEELHLLIVQSHQAGILEDIERQLMQRSVQFADLRVTDVMIPRMDIVALDLALPEDEVLDRAAQTIHTRLPVYEEVLDNLVGILHLQDLFKHVRQAPGAREPPAARSVPRSSCPSPCRWTSYCAPFSSARRKSPSWSNEHGGVEGLVTLEDIVEELVGEVHDTLEAVQPSIQDTPDGRVLVRGEVRLRELNERLGWDVAGRGRGYDCRVYHEMSGPHRPCGRRH